MSELEQKVKKSIERLKAFEPPEGYYLAFSGGKDSVVCKALLDMSGCKYDATYRVTSVDPPELVRFIKDVHPDVKREVPRYSQGIAYEKNRGKPITMWNLIEMKLLPPTRIVRYCCHHLKETGGEGRMIITGVRWAESNKRKNNHGVVTISSKTAAKEFDNRQEFRQTQFGGLVTNNDNDNARRLVETCYKHHTTTVNPIIDWQDSDVWQFIHSEKVPHCELYYQGFSRLGCIGCPMASTNEREREFVFWPKYKKAYLNAFAKMLKHREERGKMDGDMRMGNTPQSVFNWWMKYDILPGQIDLLEETEGDE